MRRHLLDLALRVEAADDDFRRVGRQAFAADERDDQVDAGHEGDAEGQRVDEEEQSQPDDAGLPSLLLVRIGRDGVVIVARAIGWEEWLGFEGTELYRVAVEGVSPVAGTAGTVVGVLVDGSLYGDGGMLFSSFIPSSCHKRDGTWLTCLFVLIPQSPGKLIAVDDKLLFLFLWRVNFQMCELALGSGALRKRFKLSSVSVI